MNYNSTDGTSDACYYQIGTDSLGYSLTSGGSIFVRFTTIGSNAIVHLNSGNSVWNAPNSVITGN